MPVFPADLRARTFNFGSGDVRRFEPYGKIVVHGDLGFSIEPVARTAANPMPRLKSMARSRRPSQSAKIIMGFNINGKPAVRLKDVLSTVYAIRQEEVELAFKEGYATPSLEGGDIGASLIRQHGLWQPVGDKDAKPEEGVQIVFFNNIDEDADEFENDIEYMAGELAKKFKQDAIIVEHMKKGIVKETVVMGR